jgi:Transcription factor WhiB
VRQIAGTPRGPERSAPLADRALWARVGGKARCADGVLDPDEWFPVSPVAETARLEAARAIAICAACPVSAECLELALRDWPVGQHGVWGGLVAAERVALRNRWLTRAHITGPGAAHP